MKRRKQVHYTKSLLISFRANAITGPNLSTSLQNHRRIPILGIWKVGVFIQRFHLSLYTPFTFLFLQEIEYLVRLSGCLPYYSHISIYRSRRMYCSVGLYRSIWLITIPSCFMIDYASIFRYNSCRLFWLCGSGSYRY